MSAHTSTLAACLAGLAECGLLLPDASAQTVHDPDRASAPIIDRDGARIGEVSAWQGTHGLILHVRAQGLPPGLHGMHVHAVGDCSDFEAFRTAGGHLEGRADAHDHQHAHGSHGGDLPNLYAHVDGVAWADVFAYRITLEDLRDADGAALIIHADPDDYHAQPGGGAGPRIACAAFARRS